MLKKMMILLVSACVLLSRGASADTRIRWHDEDDAGADTVTVVETDDGIPEDSFAQRMADTAFISQRDKRFDVPAYQYINHEPFWKNGCGPASLFNGLLAVFGDIPDEGLAELMTLMADFHRPAAYGINYNRSLDLAGPEIADYPTLAAAIGTVDRVVAMPVVNEDTVLALLGDGTEGTTVAIGRFSLSGSPETFVRIAQHLCEAGHEDAILCVATVSAGTAGVRSPFGMGENGHFITLVIQAGEFCENGTIYVVDSSPRALKNETLNESRTNHYFFAVTGGICDFRDNYHVVRLRQTLLMCVLDKTLTVGMTSVADAREQARYLNMLTTYGTGTLLIRYGDH